MILLSRTYSGYAAGTVVQLQTPVEAALIAQGMGTSSAGPVTPGAVSTDQNLGRVGIAAAGTSVVITNAKFTAESRFTAYLSNASADTTAVSITRIVPAVGSVTFVVNAGATAAVSIDWSVQLLQGNFAAP